MSIGRWMMLGFFAVVVHVCIASAIMFGKANTRVGALDDGALGVEVGLGTAGGYRDQLARKKPIVNEPMQKERKVPPPTEPLERPSPAAPVQQQADVDTLKDAPQPPVIKPQAKLQQVGEQAVKLAVEDDVPSKKMQVPKDVAHAFKPEQVKPLEDKALTAEDKRQHEDPSKGASKGQDASDMSQSTGSSRDKSSGGNSGKVNRYFAKIMRHLTQYKTYPSDLKKNKVEGVVTVSFTIDKAGNISNVLIKKSSGHQALDEAAKSMIYSGAPLPKIPRSLKKSHLTLTIPFEYSLITNKG